MKAGIITICIGLALVVSFLIGESRGERFAITEMRVELDSTQAMLVFNRLVEERKLQAWLSRECIIETRTQMDINEDQDTKLLAEFFKGKLAPWARKYVSDRDPNLPNILSSFKSKYGSSWAEIECKNDT